MDAMFVAEMIIRNDNNVTEVEVANSIWKNISWGGNISSSTVKLLNKRLPNARLYLYPHMKGGLIVLNVYYPNRLSDVEMLREAMSKL